MKERLGCREATLPTFDSNGMLVFSKVFAPPTTPTATSRTRRHTASEVGGEAAADADLDDADVKRSTFDSPSRRLHEPSLGKAAKALPWEMPNRRRARTAAAALKGGRSRRQQARAGPSSDHIGPDIFADLDISSDSLLSLSGWRPGRRWKKHDGSVAHANHRHEAEC